MIAHSVLVYGPEIMLIIMAYDPTVLVDQYTLMTDSPDLKILPSLISSIFSMCKL